MRMETSRRGIASLKRTRTGGKGLASSAPRPSGGIAEAVDDLDTPQQRAPDRVEVDRRGRPPGDLIQINEPAGGHGSHDAGDAGRAARREGLAMRDRSRLLLDSEAVYTVVGVIGFGILPIVLAIAMLFFS
jgi:hypothetical protein